MIKSQFIILQWCIILSALYQAFYLKVDILYSNCSHITFELNSVFILNFGSFFLLLRLRNKGAESATLW